MSETSEHSASRTAARHVPRLLNPYCLMTRHDPACARASTLSQSRIPNDRGEAGGIASFQRGVLTSPSGVAAAAHSPVHGERDAHRGDLPLSHQANETIDMRMEIGARRAAWAHDFVSVPALGVPSRACLQRGSPSMARGWRIIRRWSPWAASWICGRRRCRQKFDGEF